MSSIFQIVYISTASPSLRQEDLAALLKGSHGRNTRVGITGLLLYKDGQFMQALEGEEQTVKNLFAKISLDDRHHGIIPLLQAPIAERQFPDFAMAFRDLNLAANQKLPGYSEFLNTPLKGELYSKDLSKCQRLLLLFKKNLR